MTMMYAVPVAFAADKTITVTVNSNGGKFSDNSTTYTETVTVDSAAGTVNFGQLRNVPNVVAPSSTQAFDFWATTSGATSENLVADISDNAATFYAVWKTVPNGNRELDGTISVAGLENKDTVSFYQILKWDSDATETKGWVAADGFAYNETSNPNGLTIDEIKTILDIGTQANPGISSDLAAKIAKLVADKSISPATGYANIAESGGVASKADPAAGLYMALITPGQSGVQ